ncbi:MAG: acyl-ACP--UDP-N-acetylglucosamine O-acyltransferase [Rikenellaceae bacterium]
MISTLAYVDSSAIVGQDVTIEPFAYVAADTVIGDGSYIATGAVIREGARLGKNCKIHTGAVIAGVPQDLKFKGEYTTVEIGDNTMVRECATINRGTASKGKTVVGSNCLIMAYAHVGHDCVVGNHCILANQVSLAGEVEVDDWAILGGHAAVHQFTRIGKHAMISGGTLVTKDVPPYITAAFHPVGYAGMNSIGLRRRGFNDEQVSTLHEIMKVLFQDGNAYSKGVDIVENTFAQSPERDEMLNFIRNSKRGLLKQFNPNRKSAE